MDGHIDRVTLNVKKRRSYMLYHMETCVTRLLFFYSHNIHTFFGNIARFVFAYCSYEITMYYKFKVARMKILVTVLHFQK